MNKLVSPSRRVVLALALLALGRCAPAARAEERRLLYVAEPGIRNYLEYGGHGLLVFDIDHGHKFVKRIPTAGLDPQGKPDNVKGICASAATGRLYISTIQHADLPRPRSPRRSSGSGPTRGAATGWPSRPTARRSTCPRSRRTTGTSSTR